MRICDKLVSKLPHKGMIDIEEFTSNDFVLTIKREDGKELSIHITRDELKSLAEYIQALLKIEV